MNKVKSTLTLLTALLLTPLTALAQTSSNALPPSTLPAPTFKAVDRSTAKTNLLGIGVKTQMKC